MKLRTIKSAMKKRQLVKKIKAFRNEADFLKSFKQEFKLSSNVKVFNIE